MIVKTFTDYLIETSLNRILQHNEKHDAGVITAYRKAENCGEGKPLTAKDNKERNKELLKILKGLGYSVTSVIGTYPEGGKTVKEYSFLVVDINDTGKLKENIIKLGKKYEQDSILFLPKGALSNKAKACLIGTNKCEDAFPGYLKEKCFDIAQLGKKHPVFNSVVNGRPFNFKDIEEVKEYSFSSANDALYLSEYARKKLSEIEL